MRRFIARLVGLGDTGQSPERPPPRSDGLTPYVSGPEYRAAIQHAYDDVLGSAGFARAGALRWVRSRLPPIRDVVVVYALKGGTYTTRWGVSLDYVPHVVNGAIRWHATAASARVDLGYDPLDFIEPRIGAYNARPVIEDPALEPLSLVDPADARIPWWEISAWRPAEGALGEQARSARRILAMSAPWFEAINDLNSLMAAFDRERGRPFKRFGWQDYVQHGLAYSFTLSAAGQMNAAMAELRQWADRFEVDQGIRSTLEQHIRDGVTFPNTL